MCPIALMIVRLAILPGSNTAVTMYRVIHGICSLLAKIELILYKFLICCMFNRSVNGITPTIIHMRFYHLLLLLFTFHFTDSLTLSHTSIGPAGYPLDAEATPAFSPHHVSTASLQSVPEISTDSRQILQDFANIPFHQWNTRALAAWMDVVVGKSREVKREEGVGSDMLVQSHCVGLHHSVLGGLRWHSYVVDSCTFAHISAHSHSSYRL